MDSIPLAPCCHLLPYWSFGLHKLSFKALSTLCELSETISNIKDGVQRQGKFSNYIVSTSLDVFQLSDCNMSEYFVMT